MCSRSMDWFSDICFVQEGARTPQSSHWSFVSAQERSAGLEFLAMFPFASHTDGEHPTRRAASIYQTFILLCFVPTTGEKLSPECKKVAKISMRDLMKSFTQVKEIHKPSAPKSNIRLVPCLGRVSHPQNSPEELKKSRMESLPQHPLSWTLFSILNPFFLPLAEKPMAKFSLCVASLSPLVVIRSWNRCSAILVRVEWFSFPSSDLSRQKCRVSVQPFDGFLEAARFRHLYYSAYMAAAVQPGGCLSLSGMESWIYALNLSVELFTLIK